MFSLSLNQAAGSGKYEMVLLLVNICEMFRRKSILGGRGKEERS